MSKTITVPDIGQYPIIVKVNNDSYTLYPGTEMTVPDEVAALLENKIKAQPRPDPDIADKMTITRGEVKAMIEKATSDAMAAVIALIPETPEPVTIDLSGDDSPATYDDGAYIISDAATSNAIYHAITSGRPVWMQYESDSIELTSLITEYSIDDSGEDDVFLAGFGNGLVLSLQNFEDESESEGDIAPIPIRPGTSVTVVLPSQS